MRVNPHSCLSFRPRKQKRPKRRAMEKWRNSIALLTRRACRRSIRERNSRARMLECATRRTITPAYNYIAMLATHREILLRHVFVRPRQNQGERKREEKRNGAHDDFYRSARVCARRFACKNGSYACFVMVILLNDPPTSRYARLLIHLANALGLIS